MPVTINTNTAAATAARALEVANKNLTDSLKKLSTGNRIVNAYDDAAGESVQLKLKSQSARYDVLKANLMNGISFLEVQGGVVDTAIDALTRIGELNALSGDVTKSSDDIALYSTESALLDALIRTNLEAETFNGNALFGTAVNVNINIAGTAQAIGGQSLNTAVAQDYTDLSTPISATNYETDIQNLATIKATIGAQQSALNYYYDNAVVTQSNVNAARGRIVDLDIATESGVYAREQILAQAAASMLSQANNIGAQAAMSLLM